MQLRQRNHMAAVSDVAGEKKLPAQLLAYDEAIRASWRRCVHEHGLDPTHMQGAIILPTSQLREHQDRLDEFRFVARDEMKSLYQQIAGIGYCVLLSDARGVTVDFLGDRQSDADLRRTGLYLGADWSEAFTGTNGIGTCIATGHALTVHQEDHFDASHIPLTCSAAPVYDVDGPMIGILDISALSSPETKHSQHLALQLAKVFAQRMENAYFLHHFQHDWILKLSSTEHLLDLSPGFLLALDAGGRVIGHNHSAQQQFSQGRPCIIGMQAEELLGVTPGELAMFVAEPRSIVSTATGQPLLMRAHPPPAPSRPAQDTPDHRLKQERLSALGSIVVGISHELNTPLGNNKLALTTLRDRILEVKSSYASGGLTRSQIASFLEDGILIADLAHRAADRAIDLVDTFKQISAEQASWQRSSFDLATLIGETLDGLRFSYRHAPWQFAADIAPGMLMDSYPDAIRKVIVNLIENSIQHGFEGRNHGRITICGRQEAAGDILLSLADDGAGIEPQSIERIFDPFFTTRLGRGCSGLGLTIVHRIVTALLCGEISVESAPGAGATFRQRIPQQAPAVDTTPDPLQK